MEETNEEKEKMCAWVNMRKAYMIHMYENVIMKPTVLYARHFILPVNLFLLHLFGEK